MEESLEFYEKVLKEFGIKKQNINTYSPLVLAYIGDCIYELIIRSMIVAKGNEQVNKLHKKSSELVKAETQAKMIHSLMEELTEEEEHIYKRGRNAKSFTSAKNASVTDYRVATGFEALMGYLYMEGRTDRIFELIKKGMAADNQAQ
jgi:ribonuclease-3 family protein